MMSDACPRSSDSCLGNILLVDDDGKLQALEAKAVQSSKDGYITISDCTFICVLDML
jgi:hypothetical protein